MTTPPLPAPDETRDRLAVIRARLFVERTGDEFVAHAPADVAWLLEECERLRGERDAARTALYELNRRTDPGAYQPEQGQATIGDPT